MKAIIDTKVPLEDRYIDDIPTISNPYQEENLKMYTNIVNYMVSKDLVSITALNYTVRTATTLAQNKIELTLEDNPYAQLLLDPYKTDITETPLTIYSTFLFDKQPLNLTKTNSLLETQAKEPFLSMQLGYLVARDIMNYDTDNPTDLYSSKIPVQVTIDGKHYFALYHPSEQVLSVLRFNHQHQVQLTKAEGLFVLNNTVGTTLTEKDSHRDISQAIYEYLESVGQTPASLKLEVSISKLPTQVQSQYFNSTKLSLSSTLNPLVGLFSLLDNLSDFINPQTGVLNTLTANKDTLKPVSDLTIEATNQVVSELIKDNRI